MRNRRIALACTLTFSLIAAVTFGGCGRFGAAVPRRDSGELSAVRSSLDSLMDGSNLGQAHIGVAAQSLNDGQWIYHHNTDRLFMPASTAKLFTAIAALSKLGPTWRFTTSVTTDSSIVDGHALGNLLLVGSGDPTLHTPNLLDLAGDLAAMGITDIDGDLVLDVSWFDEVLYGPGWMWDEGPLPFNAPVSGLNVNGNCVRLTVRPGTVLGTPAAAGFHPTTMYGVIENRAVTGQGSRLTIGRLDGEQGVDRWLVEGGVRLGSSPVTKFRSVSHPLTYVAKIWTEAIQHSRIELHGQVRFGTSPPQTVVLARHRSTTLDVIVRGYLKQSHNLAGESLVKTLGALEYGPPGSWRSGIGVIKRWLSRSVGIDSVQYRLVDGSGLSRYNLCSPLHLVKVLSYGYHRFDIAPELMAALPVAGRDGTLRRRLAGRVGDGDLRGKTGSMSSVNGLAGYVRTADGEMLACAVLVNGFVGGGSDARALQDEIVAILHRTPRPEVGD